MTSHAPALDVRALTAGYGAAVIIRDISFEVPRGEAVLIAGPNASGKSTLLRAIHGLLRPRRGSVSVDGSDLTSAATAIRVRQGMSLLPQRGATFGALTVEENIRAAANVVRDGSRDAVESVFASFPQLVPFRHTRAAHLSVGEERLAGLAVATVLPQRKVILLDEPFAGLAGEIVDALRTHLLRLKNENAALIIVEHDVHALEGIVETVLRLEHGTFSFRGSLSAYRGLSQHG